MANVSSKDHLAMLLIVYDALALLRGRPQHLSYIHLSFQLVPGLPRLFDRTLVLDSGHVARLALERDCACTRRMILPLRVLGRLLTKLISPMTPIGERVTFTWITFSDLNSMMMQQSRLPAPIGSGMDLETVKSKCDVVVTVHRVAVM